MQSASLARRRRLRMSRLARSMVQDRNRNRAHNNGMSAMAAPCAWGFGRKVPYTGMSTQVSTECRKLTSENELLGQSSSKTPWNLGGGSFATRERIHARYAERPRVRQRSPLHQLARDLREQHRTRRTRAALICTDAEREQTRVGAEAWRRFCH